MLFECTILRQARTCERSVERRFDYCPRCGAAVQHDRVPRVFECAGCNYRYYHNVAGAVAAIIVHEHDLLTITRAADPGAGTLDLPGGFIDPGESAEMALRRELAEEIDWSGITEDIRYRGSWPNTYPYRDVLYYTIDLFYFIDCAQRPAVTAGDDAAALAWLPLDQIEPEQFFMASVRAVLAELLAEAGLPH